MKKIILICLFGLMFSQTEVSSKTYEVQVADSEILTLSELVPEYDLEWAIINIVYCGSEECSLQIYYDIGNGNLSADSSTKHQLSTQNPGAFNEYAYYYSGGGHSSTFYVAEDQEFLIQVFEPSSVKMIVTAEFPIEDTGYIEEGFDFCLRSGQNLVSFPCENPVSIETAIPENAQAELVSIIGEGVASINLNGNWVGGISSLSPGSGYWFKSNADMCFNYTCAE